MYFTKNFYILFYYYSFSLLYFIKYFNILFYIYSHSCILWNISTLCFKSILILEYVFTKYFTKYFNIMLYIFAVFHQIFQYSLLDLFSFLYFTKYFNVLFYIYVAVFYETFQYCVWVLFIRPLSIFCFLQKNKYWQQTAIDLRARTGNWMYRRSFLGEAVFLCRNSSV